MADADQPYAALERELGWLVRRVQAYGRDIARRVHPDLDSAGYSLLVRLDSDGGRAADLAGYFGVNKSAVSRQLRALEQLGLVRRDVDPADARVQRIALTEEGGRRLGEVRDARRRRFRALLAAWDPADVESFAELLRRFNELDVFDA